MRSAKVMSRDRILEGVVKTWDAVKVAEVWKELTAIPQYSEYEYDSYSMTVAIMEQGLEDKYLHGNPTNKIVKAPMHPFNTVYDSDGARYYCREAKFSFTRVNGKTTQIYSAFAIKDGDTVYKYRERYFAPLYEIQWAVTGKTPLGAEIGGGNCDWSEPLRITRCTCIDDAMDTAGLIDVTDYIKTEDE